MARPFPSRVTALVAAALVALSTPGLAIAHGLLHHEACEHAADPSGGHHDGEQHDGHELAAREGQPGPHALMADAGTPERHGHQRVDQATVVRAHASLAILPAPPPRLAQEIILVGTAELLVTAAPARASPPSAAPAQPRAPPLA